MSQRRRSARKIEETIGLMQKNFECAICLELMKNPVTTKCDHIFCRHCLLETIGRKKDAPCPLCKVPFTRRSLQPLLHWNQMVGAVANLINAFQKDTGAMFSPSRRHMPGTPSRSSQPKPSTSSEQPEEVPSQAQNNRSNVPSGIRRIQAEEPTFIEVSDDSATDSHYSHRDEKTARNVSSNVSDIQNKREIRQNQTSEIEIVDTRPPPLKDHENRPSTSTNDELLQYIAEGPLELLNALEKSKFPTKRKGKGQSKQIKKGRNVPSQNKTYQSESLEKETSRRNHLRRTRSNKQELQPSAQPIEINLVEDEHIPRSVPNENPLAEVGEDNHKAEKEKNHHSKEHKDRHNHRATTSEVKSPNVKEKNSPSTAGSDVLGTNLSVRENLMIQPETREKIQKWFKEQRTPQSIDLTATASCSESIDEAVGEDAFKEDGFTESPETSQLCGERSAVIELESEPESFYTEDTLDEGVEGGVVVEEIVKIVDGVKLVQRVRRAKGNQPPVAPEKNVENVPAKSRSKPRRKSKKKSEICIPTDVDKVAPTFHEFEPVLFDLSQRPATSRKDGPLTEEQQDVEPEHQPVLFEPETSMIKPVTRTYGRSITPSKIRKSVQENSFAMAKTPTKQPSKFFASRGVKTPVRRKVDTVEFGAASPEDPYAFRISQRTPEKKNKSRRGRSKKGKNRPELEIISVRENEEEGERNIEEAGNIDVTLTKKGEGAVSQQEIESINEMLSMAEDHELLFSQQVRDMAEEERENQKQRALVEKQKHKEQETYVEPEVLMEETDIDVQIIEERTDAKNTNGTRRKGKRSRTKPDRQKDKSKGDKCSEPEPSNLAIPDHPYDTSETEVEKKRNSSEVKLQAASESGEMKELRETSEEQIHEQEKSIDATKTQEGARESELVQNKDVNEESVPEKTAQPNNLQNKEPEPKDVEMQVEHVMSQAGESEVVTTIPDSENTQVSKPKSRKRTRTATLIPPETTTVRRTRSKGPTASPNWSGVKEMVRDLVPQAKQLKLQKVTPEKRESRRSRRNKGQQHQEKEMIDLTQEAEVVICDKDTEDSIQEPCQELCYEEGAENTEIAVVDQQVPDTSIPVEDVRPAKQDVEITPKEDDAPNYEPEINQLVEDQEILISDNNGTSADEVCLLETAEPCGPREETGNIEDDVPMGETQPFTRFPSNETSAFDQHYQQSLSGNTKSQRKTFSLSARSPLDAKKKGGQRGASEDGEEQILEAVEQVLNSDSLKDDLVEMEVLENIDEPKAQSLDENRETGIVERTDEVNVGKGQRDSPSASRRNEENLETQNSLFNDSEDRNSKEQSERNDKDVEVNQRKSSREKKQKLMKRRENKREETSDSPNIEVGPQKVDSQRIIDKDIIPDSIEINDKQIGGGRKSRRAVECLEERFEEPEAPIVVQEDCEVVEINDAGETNDVGQSGEVREINTVPDSVQETCEEEVVAQPNSVQGTCDGRGMEEIHKSAQENNDVREIATVPNSVQENDGIRETEAVTNSVQENDVTEIETVPNSVQENDGIRETEAVTNSVQENDVTEIETVPNSVQENDGIRETEAVTNSIQESNVTEMETVPNSVQENDGIMEMEVVTNEVQENCDVREGNTIQISDQDDDVKEIDPLPSIVQDGGEMTEEPIIVEDDGEIEETDGVRLLDSAPISQSIPETHKIPMPSSVEGKNDQDEMEVELIAENVKSKSKVKENVKNPKVLKESQSCDSTQSESLIKKKDPHTTNSQKADTLESEGDASNVCSVQVLTKTQDLFSDIQPTASNKSNTKESKTCLVEDHVDEINTITEEPESNSQSQRAHRRTRSQRRVDSNEKPTNKERPVQGGSQKGKKQSMPNGVRPKTNCSDDSSDEEVRVTPKSGRRAVRGLANRRTPQMVAKLAEILNKGSGTPQTNKTSPVANGVEIQALEKVDSATPYVKLPKSPSASKLGISKILVIDTPDDKAVPHRKKLGQTVSAERNVNKSPLFRVEETPAGGSRFTPSKKFRYETPISVSPVLPNDTVVAETPAFDKSIDETEPQNSESILLPPTPQVERSSKRKRKKMVLKKRTKPVAVKNPQPDFSDCDDETSLHDVDNENVLDVKVKAEKPSSVVSVEDVDEQILKAKVKEERPSSPMAYIDEEGRYVVKALTTSVEHPVEVEDRDVNSERERDKILQNIEEELNALEEHEAEKVVIKDEEVSADPEEEEDDDMSLPSLEPPSRKPKKAASVPQSVIELKESEDELMEEVIRPRRKSQRYVIEDDVSVDEAEIETDPGSTPSRHHLSTTCSSAFSSQSDHGGTDQREHLEEDCEKLQYEIAQIEAQLAAKSSKAEIDQPEEEDTTLTEDVETIQDHGDPHDTDDETCDVSRVDQQLEAPSKSVDLSGKSECVIPESLPGPDTSDYGQKLESLNPTEETCDLPVNGVEENIDNDVNDEEDESKNVMSSQKSVISQSQRSSKSLKSPAKEEVDRSVSSPPPPTPPSPTTLQAHVRQVSKQQTDKDSPTTFLDKYKKNHKLSPNATDKRASRKRKLDMDVDEKPSKLMKKEPLDVGVSRLTAENQSPALVRVKTEEDENGPMPVSPSPAAAAKRKPQASPLQAKMSPNVSSSESYMSTQIEFPSRPNWCFVVSGVKKVKLKSRIQKFQMLVGARDGQRITPSVTHLIVAPADGTKDHLVCQRTLKYFQAIAARKWVVSSKWVTDSMATGQLLPEDDYEIHGDTSDEVIHHGPRRSREEGGTLFSKYEMYCMGEFNNVSRDDLRNLVELCGGSTVQDPALFSFEPHQKQLIIVEPGGHINLPVLRKLYQQYAVHIVGKDWILDSIGQYKQQRLTDYIISLTGDTQTPY